MEKDILQSGNRISIYVVMGAFLLSLILGFFAKNPAGIVIMRAFISTLLFGVLFRGGIFILMKYIPDIEKLEGTEAEAVEKEKGEEIETLTGSVVDYTVGGDESVSEEESGFETGDVSESAPLNIEESEDGEAETSPAGELGESEALDEESEPLNDLPALDTLLEEDEEEIAVDDKPGGESSTTGTSNLGEYINVGIAQIPNEPETIAKAIRKVMKQNES